MLKGRRSAATASTSVWLFKPFTQEALGNAVSDIAAAGAGGQRESAAAS
jgi:hypothetical protein